MKASRYNQEAFSLNTYFTVNNEIATTTIKDITGDIVISIISIAFFRFYLMKVVWGVLYIGAILFEKI